MTHSTDYDNRPLDEVERLRQAQVEALKRENDALRGLLCVTAQVVCDTLCPTRPRWHEALCQNVQAALRNHEPEAKERQ